MLSPYFPSIIGLKISIYAYIYPSIIGSLVIAIKINWHKQDLVVQNNHETINFKLANQVLSQN